MGFEEADPDGFQAAFLEMVPVVVNIPEDWRRYFRAFLCIMREDTRRNRKWKPR